MAKLSVLLVACLHVLFMILEMLLWNTPAGRHIFGLTREVAQQTAVLAANQGLYNGFLAAGLFWGLAEPVQHRGDDHLFSGLRDRCRRVRRHHRKTLDPLDTGPAGTGCAWTGTVCRKIAVGNPRPGSPVMQSTAWNFPFLPAARVLRWRCPVHSQRP